VEKSCKFGEKIEEKGKFKLVVFKKGKIPPDTKYQFQWLPKIDVALGLKGQLQVEQLNKRANIIQVSFQDTIPSRAAQFVNKLVEVYLNERIKQKTQQADQTLRFIDTQLGKISKELAESELALEDYKKTHKVVDLDLKAQATLKKLNEVEEKYNQLRLKESLLSFILKKVQNPHSLTSISTDVIDDPVLGKMVGELQQLLLQREQFLMEYTPQHPAVVRVEKQIKMLQTMIVNRLQNIKKILESKKVALEKLINEYTALLKNLPENERKLIDLKRRYLVNEKIYSYLLEKRAATAIAKSSIISDNRVIDPALVPEKPFKPKTKLVLVVAGVTGVILGVFLVFLKEFFNSKITSLEEVERNSPIPIVGIVPLIKGLKNGKNSSLLSPKSPLMEAFRVIRTNIKFLSPQKQVITITSTIKGEGKSTIASHLAIVYALANRKTAIVNLDMRKPTLHTIFNIPNDIGISNVLAGEGELEKIIHKSSIPNLYVIPSGITPPNPGELLQSPKMEEVTRFLRANFDVVIFDTPPVGLVIDALEVLNEADINLYIVRLNYSKREFFKTIGDLKENKKIRGMGLIVNGAKGRGGYYTYGYGYGYGHRGYYSSEKGNR
jgi:capsular exopolysaccharide synthesis family protein